LYVLKSIIKDDNVYTEALHREHASGVSILRHDHGHPGQTLRQEHWLIASGIGRHETLLPI
jgi:hypothetical protein